MPSGFKQNSKSKVYGSGVTEHASIRKILDWIWRRHALFVDDVVVPPHVALYMAKCDRCASGSCDGSHLVDSTAVGDGPGLVESGPGGDQNNEKSSSSDSSSSSSSTSGSP